ncbi:alpha/beta hydrolase [Planctomonas sp. JC2975]|uniref:alpha/beta fold hydrolase n=1 Tax=Planctomonas sp. JC2975 TaxID=2729626 RepID=UPI001F1083B6|nr:alpha/beta hydrolase [Planctomonas sp. JC2975]
MTASDSAGASRAHYRPFRVPVRGGELAGAQWNPDAAGMPVLAIHGITATHREWPLLADRLARRRIIAPDLRGRGRSNALPAPWGMRDHADDMAALLDAFGVDRALVVGHSMGGFVAVRTADQHPDRVAGLVLVDGGLPLPFRVPDDVAPEDAAAYLLGPAGERLTRVYPSRDAYADFWRAHPAFAENWNDEVAAYIDYDLDETDGGFRSSAQLAAVATNIVQQDGSDGYREALTRLRVPVSFLRAPRGLLNETPGLYPDAVIAAAAGLVPGMVLTDVDDVNHYSIVLTDHGIDQVAPVVERAARKAEPSSEEAESA